MTQDELRDEKYKAAPEQIQELYASPIVGTAIRSTFDALGLEPRKYYDYVHIFGDAFLNIAPPTSIKEGLRARFGLSDGAIDGIIKRVLASVDEKVFTPNKTTTPAPTQPATAPVAAVSTPPTPRAAAPTAPHVPATRVMPHSKAEIGNDSRASTELPNALLQNLKASLMHSAPEEPLEGTNPAPSYNAILEQKPPTPPQP